MYVWYKSGKIQKNIFFSNVFYKKTAKYKRAKTLDPGGRMAGALPRLTAYSPYEKFIKKIISNYY